MDNRATLFYFFFVSKFHSPIFPMQFDTLISNMVSVSQISEKNVIADRLKVNIGPFLTVFVILCVAQSPR